MTATPPRVLRSRRCTRALAGVAGLAATLVSGSLVGVVPAAQAGLANYTEASAVKPLPTLASLTACSVVPGRQQTWAVGYYSHDSAQQAYATHSTKRGRWTSVAVAKAPSVFLQGVAAGTSRSIWAVGDRTSAKGEAPIIEHSTGGRFTPAPATLGMGSLQAVAASSASNAWAVGTHPSGAPLVARRSGGHWRPVSLGTLPAGAGTSVQLVGVATSDVGNVWLVGETSGGPVVARWDGHAFALALLQPPAVAAGMVPTAINTTASGNVWIAGYVPGPAGAGASAAVTSHYDGAAWTPVQVPSRGVRNVPSSIVAVGSSVYLAGYAGPKRLATSTSLVLERTGSTWRSDPVSTPGHNGVLLSVCASSKAAVAVGAWYAGAAAGARRTPPHPLVVVRGGHAWRRPPA